VTRGVAAAEMIKPIIRADIQNTFATEYIFVLKTRSRTASLISVLATGVLYGKSITY